MKGNKEIVVDDLTMPQELVDAMTSIGEMTDDIVRAIPEPEFRKKYLPIFTSTASDVDLSPWLDISGTAYESVNVVKDGRVLFVVPPLVKRHPTLVNVDSRYSAATIAAEARQYESRHPNQGTQHLVRHLSVKVVKDGVNLEEVAQWNEILAYYGQPTIGDLKPEEGEGLLPITIEFADDDFEEA